MARGIWIRKKQKGDEVWIVFRDQTGKRHREKVGINSTKIRHLAKEILIKRQTEILEGKYFPERRAQSKTYKDLAEQYWNLVGSKGCPGSRPPKFLLDRTIAKFGDKKADSITVGELQAFYNQKLLESSPSTANRYMDFIRAVFNRAKEWGNFYGVNPAARVRRRKNNPSRTRFLSSNEISQLLDACHSRLYPLIVCAVTTGMRKSEILRLEWGDVDLENGYLHVHITKSGSSREIPISSKLRRVFEEMAPKPEGRVFDMPEITFRRLFECARKNAQLMPFRFHDLRHTFASHFVMKTGDLIALQKILGHATPAMVLRYAHLAKAHLVSEMAIFDSSLPALRSFAKDEISHHLSHQAFPAVFQDGQKSVV